jgi:hypothetical protein
MRTAPVSVALAMISVIATGCSPKLEKHPEITGKVALKSTPPLEIAIQFDPASARLQPTGATTRHYLVSQDGRLANVFVYVKQGLEGQEFTIPQVPAVMEIRRCLIEPYVLGIRANQTLKYRTADPILHNARFVTDRDNRNGDRNFAMPFPLIKEKFFARQWRKLCRRPPPRQAGEYATKFGYPEVFVRVKCDVHPWEFGYIGVVEHPFFAVTDRTGAFQFPSGLPPGKYVIEARHLRAGAVTQEVTVAKGSRLNLNFTLEVAPSSRR